MEADSLTSEIRRLDELIIAERTRVNEAAQLRADYSIQLAVAEAKRIDAIRAVDVNAVSVANERATAQAAVLANQVAASAETLRSLVAATASTVAQQLAQVSGGLSDRLTAIEKAQYESKGTGTGRSDMYGWIFAAVMALVTIGSVIWMILKK